MKALILAAGLGTRLVPLTNTRPKSLVAVNGKPILIKQIENLHENDITDITIISGYKSNVLEKTVHNYWPKINIIESVNYATTNNMYSAYLGIKSMFSDNSFDAFLMMNADVFFDSSVIDALLKFEASNAIVVDIGRYLEESMKVIEKNNRIITISKQVAMQDALGSSIDIYKFSPDGGKAFLKHCSEYIEKRHELKLWSEVALNDTLIDVAFRACPLNGRWFEIDTYKDLKLAETLFSPNI